MNRRDGVCEAQLRALGNSLCEEKTAHAHVELCQAHSLFCTVSCGCVTGLWYKQPLAVCVQLLVITLSFKRAIHDAGLGHRQ